MMSDGGIFCHQGAIQLNILHFLLSVSRACRVWSVAYSWCLDQSQAARLLFLTRKEGSVFPSGWWWWTKTRCFPVLGPIIDVSRLRILKKGNVTVQGMIKILDPLGYSPLPGSNPNLDVAQIRHQCPSEILPENHTHALRCPKSVDLFLAPQSCKASWCVVMQVLDFDLISSLIPRSGQGGRGERKEFCHVMEWWSRHDSNGHEKQIKNDYGRRAEGDERSIL